MKSADQAFKAEFVIFTDGACSGNPGPGGYGAVVAHQGEVWEIGGYIPETTNNRMEMKAVLEALNSIEGKPGHVIIYTDSTYVIRGITQWIWGWRKRGWKNAEGQDVANKDMWQVLAEKVQSRSPEKIEWLYSRGHIGTPGNERCDEIAVAFSQGERPSLYRGSLLKYPIAIYDVPENTELPEMKPKKEKTQAHSYLSLLGGSVYRHRDWASCERRVKGQSGAKFKKALTATEETEILRTWGLAPGTPIKDA